MRIIKIKKNTVLTVSLFFFISACAGESVQYNKQQTKTSKRTFTSVKSEESSKYPKHIHPDTSCFKAFIHSHEGGEKEHSHAKSNCTQKEYGTGNAHEHPANNKTGSLRHVHPNGANPHTHH